MSTENKISTDTLCELENIAHRIALLACAMDNVRDGGHGISQTFRDKEELAGGVKTALTAIHSDLMKIVNILE